MAPRRRGHKAKAKSGSSSSGPAKKEGADEWNNVLGDLNTLATQNKLSSDVPGAGIAANVAAVAAFFLYANAIVVCQFPYDDNKAIRQNPDVLNLRGEGTGMSPFPQFYYNDFWGTPLDSPYTHKSYRPLVIQSFRLDASISTDAWVFHFFNGLLYAVCAWLVVDVLLQPALRAGVAASDSAKQNALILSGLWFAAHPVHVESVAGLVGRAEILSAILCMLGAKFGDRQNLLISAACFAAACLCKETAVVVPAMIGAVELLASFIAPKREIAAQSSGGKTKGKKQIERAITYFATSFGYLLFRSWLFASSRGSTSTLRGSVMLEDSFMQHVHPLDKFRTALFIMAKYTQLLVWPGALSCDYGLGVIDPVVSWVSIEMLIVVLAAGSVLAWIAYGLFWLHKTGDKSPLLAVGWAFAPLVPASHIVDIGTVMAERLAFTPTIGVAMLICHLCGLAALQPKVWRNLQIALLAVCTYFAIRTMNRIPDWEESKTLFLADVKSHPRGVKLLDSAAKQLLSDDPALGFEYAKRAQEITDEYGGIFKEERYITGLLQMANLKVRTEKWSEGANLTEAIEYLDEILQHGEDVKPLDEDTSRIVYTIKGTAFFRRGRPSGDPGHFATAIENFRIAESLDSSSRGDRVLYCEFATCLAQAGRKEEAYEKFQKCYSREPEEDLVAADFGNYAVLMKELSGVDITEDREAAVAAAKKWGDRGIEGIEKYMSHESFKQSHSKVWVKVVGDIKLLQSGMNVGPEY